MAMKYYYAGQEYDTESDAQNAVTVIKLRLENNPTDWIKAKEIRGSADTGWHIQASLLTDAELLNPSSDKTYMAYSPITGENVMPLTATELEAKRDEYRTPYAQQINVGSIYKGDQTQMDCVEEIISTTTDMSGYV